MHKANFTRPDCGASKLFLPATLIFCTGALIYLKMGLVFIFVAMIPSVITYYIDSSRSRATFKTVLACNIGTALHPIADLYSHGVRMSHERVSESFGDMRIWLYIYMGAAAGWGLIYFCRFLAHFTVDTYHEYQVFHLKKQQDWLTQEWGNGIIPEEEE